MPEVQDNPCPSVTFVLFTIISVPDVPTVSPEAIVVPLLSLSSARAAVPELLAVTLNGVPSSVATLLAMEKLGFCNVNVARTPVAPDREDVPMTSRPKLGPPSTDWPRTAAVVTKRIHAQRPPNLRAQNGFAMGCIAERARSAKVEITNQAD